MGRVPQRNEKVGGPRAAHRYVLVGLLVAAAAGFFLDMEEPAGSAAAAHRPSGPGAARPMPGVHSADARNAERATAQDPRQLALTLERVLVSADASQRETAFSSVLPELLVVSPGLAVDVLERAEPGEARDALRDEVARQWITRDREAAIAWIHSLANETDRRAGATAAMRKLAASSPERAIELADEFGIGRDDGSLEHLVQIWAAENPEEALRWVQAQPEGPGVTQLRARIEHVLAQRGATQP